VSRATQWKGSKCRNVFTDIVKRLNDVRFTPESRHR
jgi:hypothetical protein